jgi:hypothetical protein
VGACVSDRRRAYPVSTRTGTAGHQRQRWPADPYRHRHAPAGSRCASRTDSAASIYLEPVADTTVADTTGGYAGASGDPRSNVNFTVAHTDCDSNDPAPNGCTYDHACPGRVTLPESNAYAHPHADSSTARHHHNIQPAARRTVSGWSSPPSGRNVAGGQRQLG